MTTILAFVLVVLKVAVVTIDDVIAGNLPTISRLSASGPFLLLIVGNTEVHTEFYKNLFSSCRDVLCVQTDGQSEPRRRFARAIRKPPKTERGLSKYDDCLVEMEPFETEKRWV
jgi:hypothetical protein